MTSLSRPSGTRRPRPGVRPWSIAIAVFLAVMVVLQLLPFWLALTTATKPRTDLSSALVPPTGGIDWSNFEAAITTGNILQAVANTALITVVSTALVCILGAMAAYPLARRITRLNTAVSLLLLAMIMVPPLSILVPLYSMLTEIGAINTYWGQILVSVAGGLPLAVFLYTAFLRGVPGSLDEAAQIDGANVWQIFFKVLLPLLKPVTATVVILTGTGVWNEYALSVFILTRPENQMIAPAVGSFFAQQSSNLGAGAAAALIAVMPVLVAYLFLQRFFMSGMVAGALK